jgi:hypothetical protein
MIRFSIFLITVALIAGMVGCPPPPTPIPIGDWYDLDVVRNNLGDSYILVNDLDSTTAGYTELASPIANGGAGWQPIGNFTGTFDGQGYEICDLFINRPYEGYVGYVGLFGSVGKGGVIKNLGVVNAEVTGGHGAVGSLAGVNKGTMSNSYSTGTVVANWTVGGLVGENWGTVTNSYSSANVTGHNSGGLVGVIWEGTVTNSYSTANVTGGILAGGLVALNNKGILSNSYSTGSVTGDDNVGGLVGRNTATVSNSFWDTETSGQVTSDVGTCKPTAEMQDIATFSGAAWNIIEVGGPGARNPAYIWNIVNGLTYPFLSWQP